MFIVLIKSWLTSHFRRSYWNFQETRWILIQSTYELLCFCQRVQSLQISCFSLRPHFFNWDSALIFKNLEWMRSIFQLISHASKIIKELYKYYDYNSILIIHINDKILLLFSFQMISKDTLVKITFFSNNFKSVMMSHTCIYIFRICMVSGTSPIVSQKCLDFFIYSFRTNN